jgi:hypothetical protein
MSNLPEIPHRRHQLMLKLEADDIEAMLASLRAIEHDLLIKQRDHDWNHPVEITSGGYDSGWHLTVTSDLSIEGDTYRASLKAWVEQNRAARRATP